MMPERFNDSVDGGADGEHNGVGLVAISTIFATQEDFFLYDSILSDRVWSGQ